jgi:hypothetical protein
MSMDIYIAILVFIILKLNWFVKFVSSLTDFDSPPPNAANDMFFSFDGSHHLYPKCEKITCFVFCIKMMLNTSELQLDGKFKEQKFNHLTLPEGVSNLKAHYAPEIILFLFLNSFYFWCSNFQCF